MGDGRPSALVTLVVVVALAGCGATSGVESAERPADGFELTPAAVPDDGPSIIPGVEARAVRRPDQLAAAHRTGLVATSYSLSRTREVTDASGEEMNAVRLDVAATPEGAVYNVSRIAVSAQRFASADRYSRIDAWANESGFYGRFVDQYDVERTWSTRGGRTPVEVSDRSGSAFVATAFTAFDVRAVGETVVDGDVRYRFESDTVVDTDALPGPASTEGVTNGSLVATVGAGGVVHSLVVSYDARYRDVPVHIELRLTVVGIGTVTPRQPGWVGAPDQASAQFFQTPHDTVNETGPDSVAPTVPGSVPELGSADTSVPRDRTTGRWANRTDGESSGRSTEAS